MNFDTNALNQIFKVRASKSLFLQPQEFEFQIENQVKTVNAVLNESKSRHGQGMSFHQDRSNELDTGRNW